MRDRTCINCDRPLPSDAPYQQRYCDGCRPRAVREYAREASRRADERYKAARLEALALLDPMRCRHCNTPLARPAPNVEELKEFPKRVDRVKWFCDRDCQRIYREDGKAF